MANSAEIDYNRFVVAKGEFTGALTGFSHGGNFNMAQ
jgi:hypothetical protein